MGHILSVRPTPLCTYFVRCRREWMVNYNIIYLASPLTANIYRAQSVSLKFYSALISIKYDHLLHSDSSIVQNLFLLDA